MSQIDISVGDASGAIIKLTSDKAIKQLAKLLLIYGHSMPYLGFDRHFVSFGCEFMGNFISKYLCHVPQAYIIAILNCTLHKIQFKAIIPSNLIV